MFTNLNLTDMETCYKVFRREVIQGIQLKSDRFGFEPEITAKVARLNFPARDGRPARKCRIYEIPVSYHGRTYAEGKKIGIKDGIQALYCILRVCHRRLSGGSRAMSGDGRRSGGGAWRRWRSAAATLVAASGSPRPPRSPPAGQPGDTDPAKAKADPPRPRPRPRPGRRPKPASAAIPPASTWAGRSPT